MDTKIELRRATQSDISIIHRICADARAYQRELGFFQWADGYPSRAVIEHDITSGQGYTGMMDGKPIGYCVINCEGDAEYDSHPEIWSYSGPYAAVHRLAMDRMVRGRGLGVKFYKAIENEIVRRDIRNIRVDTGLENTPMQHLLLRAGFISRGKCEFVWGQRFAYEKQV